MRHGKTQSGLAVAGVRLAADGVRAARLNPAGRAGVLLAQGRGHRSGRQRVESGHQLRAGPGLQLYLRPHREGPGRGSSAWS